MSCNIKLERDVNQVLWNSVFDESRPYGRDGNGFENDVFEVRPYDWSEENNDYHFYHKPSGLKICWYKYSLRSPMSNMEITHEQFLTVLRDCFNSLHKNVKYQIEPWWEKRTKPDETLQLEALEIIQTEQLNILNNFVEKLKDKKGKNYPFTSTVFISDIDKTYEEIVKSLNRHEKEPKGED